MKTALATMMLVGLLAPASARAAFIDCDILSGQPIACQNGFEGTAVVEDRGIYRECTFRDGRATECGKAFDGRALVNHEGIFQMCDVAEGKVYRCVAWAQGRAPQWKAEPNQEKPNLSKPAKLASKGTLAPAATKPAKIAKIAKKPAAKKTTTANRGSGRKANPT
ncbi:MAG TPA: hypothetical protein VGK67_02960 [Myxococcales bacterium]|jgi:hypothetical protein